MSLKRRRTYGNGYCAVLHLPTKQPQTAIRGTDNAAPEGDGQMRLFFAGLLLFPLLGLADDDDRACSVSTLNGDYGLIVTGTRTLGSVTENFVTISLVKFDGKGGFTAEGVSHGGTTGVRKGPASGTYIVNANCTGAW